MKHLKRFPEVFSISVEGNGMVGTKEGWVTLHTSLKTSEERTNVVESVMHTLEQERIIPGWRNEVTLHQTMLSYWHVANFETCSVGGLI